MSGFQENLLVEAIGLVVGLAVTYLIVDWVIKQREKKAWEPARRRLLSNLKRQCEGALIAWGQNTTPKKLDTVDGGVQLSNDVFKKLATELQAEIDELEAIPHKEVYDQRPEDYWRAQVHGLATIKESLRLAIDRAQLTLRQDPELVEAISKLETAYMPVPGLNDHLRALEQQRSTASGWASSVIQESTEKQLRLGSFMLTRTFSRFLELWRMLEDVPGMME